jgi:hypothetical protein
MLTLDGKRWGSSATNCKASTASWWKSLRTRMMTWGPRVRGGLTEGSMNDSPHTFSVGLACRGSVVLPVGEPPIVRENMPADNGPVTVHLFTGYRDIGLGKPYPDGLRFEIWLPAADVSAAADHAQQIAGGLAEIAAFCANATVDPPTFGVAVDSTPGVTNRAAILAVDEPNATSTERQERYLPEAAFLEVVQAIIASPHGSRVARAIGQYGMALRYWRAGWHMLAMFHVNSACEALTPTVEQIHRERLNLDGGGAR